ncbi:MAG: aminodeoxychorismate synthase component I [Acidobacteria bacterium]|nr:aminodeoxychorismate synthase component I [Acidobacteriota bacterium]
MRLFSAKLPSRVNMADAFITLHKNDKYAFYLDREINQDNPFSVIGGSHSVLSEAEAKGYLTGISSHKDSSLPFDFRPGLVGAISYEGEQIWLPVDRALVLDHKQGVLYFLGLFESEAEFQHWEQAALLRLALIGGERANYLSFRQVEAPTSISFRHSDSEYLSLIESCKESIAKGDAYQLCLTNQITLETSNDPFAVYLNLRSISPAPYSAYIKLGDTAIVSSSPEQFLKVSNGLVSTKPIKGTRPRGRTQEEDLQLAEELRTNEKERAENLMIVDLMRNDLALVSEPDDVVVTKLFDVESYASVHQLVSTVTAKLKPGLDVFDAIKAAFPAGSMTGAPKISAIEILAGLENGPRGIYSGALGFIGSNGSCELGMTIRTIVFEEGRATIGIGGGITIDSVASEELAETKLKAKALLSALGVLVA